MTLWFASMIVLIQLPSKLCYDGICGVTQIKGTAFSVLTRLDSHFRWFIFIFTLVSHLFNPLASEFIQTLAVISCKPKHISGCHLYLPKIISLTSKSRKYVCFHRLQPTIVRAHVILLTVVLTAVYVFSNSLLKYWPCYNVQYNLYLSLRFSHLPALFEWTSACFLWFKIPTVLNRTDSN